MRLTVALTILFIASEWSVAQGRLTFINSAVYDIGDPDRSDSEKRSAWNGKWFPAPPGDEVLYDSLLEDKRSMGVVRADCDDAKTNLTLDNDNSKMHYKCYSLRYRFLPNPTISPKISCDHVPKAYVAKHECMDVVIDYHETIPTFGTHRPLWPKYGTYQYVPVQRWLHNLEHGAIVMLYHPCASSEQVDLLKRIVKRCLYRHIITPYAKLTSEYPLALVAWGCRLQMSKVDTEIVEGFIKEYALRGPEQKWDDGQFDDFLLNKANVVTDQEDSELCPRL